MAKKGKPKPGWIEHSETEKKRVKQALFVIAQKTVSHRAAERMWGEARRNAPTGEVVTGWAGIVT